MVELDTLQNLVACLRESSYRWIGVDGVDGCGKTTLAKALAEQLGVPLISLDDYLDTNQGGYLAHLRYHELKKVFDAKSQCIVEGVCLLQASDERECDIVVENVEVFLEAERESVEMFTLGEPDQINPALPKLAEELIRYHASYRPFEQATFWYCRDE